MVRTLSVSRFATQHNSCRCSDYVLRRRRPIVDRLRFWLLCHAFRYALLCGLGPCDRPTNGQPQENVMHLRKAYRNSPSTYGAVALLLCGHTHADVGLPPLYLMLLLKVQSAIDPRHNRMCTITNVCMCVCECVFVCMGASLVLDNNVIYAVGICDSYAT